MVTAVANRKTCNGLVFRDNARQIRHMPTARTRKHIRASTTAMLVLPRMSRRSSLRVPPRSLQVSVFYTNNRNKRNMGAACSTMQVARLPANLITRYRSRESRLHGGRGYVTILGTHVVSRQHTTRRTGSDHGEHSLTNGNSHDRGVHACGCPRGHVASRHIGFATCGLSRIISKRLSSVLSILRRRSLTRHLRARLGS